MPTYWIELAYQLRRRWNDLYDGQRSLFKLLAVVVALAIALPVAYTLAKPSINRWRHEHALRQADEFERAEDYRNMVLALHRATQIAPGDVATWQRVAETLDRMGANDAIVARENVVALSSGDPSSRVALAATAIRFGISQLARDTLRSLAADPAQRETYLRLSADLARLENDPLRFATLLAELHALRPDDLDTTYNYALARLASHAPETQEQGARDLQTLLDKPEWQVRAALALLRYGAKRGSPELAREIILTIIERLLPEKSRGPDPWPELLEALQTAAASQGASDIVRVVEWMASVRRSDVALAWIDSFPLEQRETPGLLSITAELAARLEQLDRLRALLRSGAWGLIDSKSIDCAMEARREQTLGNVARSVTLWQEALNASDNPAVTLQALARLARIWQDDRTLEAALRAVLRLRPQSPWANRELRDFYLQTGNTTRLLALTADQVARDPSDVAALGLWIRVGVALNQVTPTMERALESAPAAARAAPSLQIAYAALAWRSGEKEQATRILEALPAEFALRPETLWLKVALLSDDQTPAPPEITRQIPESSLLPEERALLLNWSKVPHHAAD